MSFYVNNINILTNKKIDKLCNIYLHNLSIYINQLNYFLDLKKLGIFTLSLSKSNKGSV